MLVSGILTVRGDPRRPTSAAGASSTTDPSLLDNPMVAPHLEYADRLLLPGAGFFILVVLTGVLNPRTGVLRTVLPILLVGFAVVVLVLVVLSGDSGARAVCSTTIVEAF